MYNLINNNGKILATGTMTKIERLQERIDPFAVKTAIVEDESREQHASSEYDLPVGFHYDDGQSVDEMEPVYDGFPVEILRNQGNKIVVRVKDGSLLDDIIENGYVHNGRLYKPAFVGASQARAGCLTLISENKYIDHNTDGMPIYIVSDTGWTEYERNAYESHPSVIRNSNLKDIIKKTRDSKIEKLSCDRIPHLDHIHCLKR